MLCMDELSLPSLQRLIFSKSTVVKNLAKGKTKVKRESSFTFPFSYPFTPSINEHKYILFRSLLSHFNSTGLYIYLDVNTYVPPALFSRLLSILRVSAGSSPDPVFSLLFLSYSCSSPPARSKCPHSTRNSPTSPFFPPQYPRENTPWMSCCSTRLRGRFFWNIFPPTR